MSIADSILSAIIWLYQNTILAILPLQFPFLPITDFSEKWENIATWLLTSYSAISFFVPMTLLFGLIITVFSGEIILVSIRGIKYLIATFRGSGT